MVPKIVKIKKESGIPLLGAIFIGIIDRGTNILQVRCTSICNMKCEFCSTNANNFDVHPTNYIVDIDYLIEEVEKIAKIKGSGLTIFLDSVGEPMTHPDFVSLVKGIHKIPEVKEIIVITNGVLLTKEKVDELEKAGLTRINLSVHSLDKEQSKQLFGSSSYNIEKIIEMIRYISKSKIELMLTPVFLPDVNDGEIEKIIQLTKEINCLVGIQNYETYKYSRKIKGTKKITYWKFYKKIKEWEKAYDIKLKFHNEDFEVEKKERIPEVFKRGDKIKVKVVCPSWIKDQMIGVAKDRCITINGCKAKIGETITVKILQDKNNLYLCE